MTVEDYEARRIIEDLRRDHAPVYDWDTFDARLKRCVEGYAGRRTIHADMVRNIAELAYGYVAERLAAADQEQTVEREAQVAKFEGVIERLEKHLATVREQRDFYQQRCDEKRTIREEREAARGDGDTQVTISTGYEGWTVAMLEEIAYRLRSGGAVDDTPVDLDNRRAIADVPAPNTVTLEAPSREPEPTRLDSPTHDGPRARWSVPRLVGPVATTVLFVLTVLAGVVFR